MSDAAVWLLAVMAVALVAMAAVQVGAAIVALRLTRQLSSTVDELRRDVRPLLDKAGALVDEANRVTSLALTQVERVDAAVALTSRRLDETLQFTQNIVGKPLRHSSAAVAAFRAAWAVVRHVQDRRHSSRDTDDDALFVG